MRHSDPGGRFTIPWEQREIYKGIDSDLRAPVGEHIDWIEFDYDASEMDVIYDVGNRTVGRQWKAPRRLPAYAAIIFQGPSVHNERGFYNTDTLRVSCAMNVVREIYPEIIWEPDIHIKDRVLYRGKVYIPTQINLHGILRDDHTIFTIMANQVNPEEYVNDPWLLYWAKRSIFPPQPYDPQRHKERTTVA